MTGCGGAAEAEADELGEAEQAFCGPPPPPLPCNTVVCIPGDQAYEYVPLPAGTICNGNGLCDAQGNCNPAPPALQTVNIAIDDTLRTQVGALLRGSTISIDGTDSVPPLVIGSYTECVDGPGPGPLICYQVADTTNAFVRFTDSLKSLYRADTGQTLNDLALPNIGIVCGGPWLFAACANVNQVRGDLGDIGIGLGSSSGGPTINLTLPLDSGNPTVLMDLLYPNVDLDDMVVHYVVVLGVANKRLRIVSVSGWLDYDLNLTNFPDWLIEPFYDIEGRVYSELSQRLTAVFADPQRRAALATALTKGLDQVAWLRVPGWRGFREIHAVRNVSGALQIDYLPW